MAQPVADTESAEFRKISIVENENEQTIFMTDALDRMTMPVREIPNVTGPKSTTSERFCGSIVVTRHWPLIT